MAYGHPSEVSTSRSAMLDFHWRAIARGLMVPYPVVKRTISCQTSACSPHAEVVPQIELLVTRSTITPHQRYGSMGGPSAG